MLYELQIALMNRYNSADGATLRGLTQGLWEEEAPSSIALETQTGTDLPNITILPFITFTIENMDLEQNFCSDMYEEAVQFVVHGDGNNKSSSNLLQAGTELLDLYNGKLLTMSNDYTMIRCDCTNIEKEKDDNKMWNIIYEFKYLIQKDVTRESV